MHKYQKAKCPLLIFGLGFTLLAIILSQSVVVPAFANTVQFDNSINGNHGIVFSYHVSPIVAITDSQSHDSTSKIVISDSSAVEGSNYTVTYNITNGKVLGMKIDPQAKSLLVAVGTTGDGALTISLPRALIDSKAGNLDDKYYVLVNAQEADFIETNTAASIRTLSIPLVDGAEEVEIMGTRIVPEFDSIVTAILAIGIISIIAVTSKFGSRFMSR